MHVIRDTGLTVFRRRVEECSKLKLCTNLSNVLQVIRSFFSARSGPQVEEEREEPEAKAWTYTATEKNNRYMRVPIVKFDKLFGQVCLYLQKSVELCLHKRDLGVGDRQRAKALMAMQLSKGSRCTRGVGQKSRH